MDDSPNVEKSPKPSCPGVGGATNAGFGAGVICGTRDGVDKLDSGVNDEDGCDGCGAGIVEVNAGLAGGGGGGDTIEMGDDFDGGERKSSQAELLGAGVEVV